MMKNKILQILLLLLAINITSMTFAQSQRNSNNLSTKKSRVFKNLEKMSKEELIRLAIRQINDSAFDVNNFDRVKVKICKDKEKSVWVSFRMSYQVIQKSLDYCYGVGVDLVDGLTSWDLISYNDAKRISSNDAKSIYGEKIKIVFPSITDGYKEVVQFVLNSINKSDEVAHIPAGKLPEGDFMRIYDYDSYYNIEIRSEFKVSGYKIEKSTGRLYDVYHEHNIPMPANTTLKKKCYTKE